MGKIINAYGGYTATQIKNKSTAGISTMTVVNNTVDCTDIKVSGIKNAIGASTANLAGLCTSNNVNPYSYFSSREWHLNAGVLEASPKTPYQMGYFACYNHNAVAPSISVDNVTASSSAYAFNFYCFVSMGEYDFRDATQATEIVCKVIDNANSLTVATYYADISTSDSYVTGAVFSGTISNPSNHTSFSVQTYFAGAGHIKICNIPNVASSVNFTVTIQASIPPTNGYFGGVSLGADFFTEYPTAMLIEDNTHCSIDANLDTYNVKILGVDTDGDNIGDMTGISFALYAKKGTSGTWTYCNTIRPARALQTGAAGSLPFTITSTDTVYFEIRIS